MRTTLGAILGVLASLLGLAAILVVAVVGLLQSGALNGVIEDALAAQVGRPAHLEQTPSLGFEDGALTLSLGPLSVPNADWAEQPDFARIQQLHASLRLAPLLSGRVELRDVVIEAPQLHLARAADGKVNWPEGGATEDGPVWVPKIENLVIRDADVTYADAAAGTDAHLVLDEATGRLGGDQDLALDATGRLQDAPLELRAKGGSLAELLGRGAMGEPAKLEATLGNSRITAQTTSFADLGALDATVQIDAEQTLTDLLASFGVAAADLPPFEAKAQVEPGEGGSLVTADLSVEDASVHLDGKVDDLSAPMQGFSTQIDARGSNLGALLALGGVGVQGALPDYHLAANVAGGDGAYRIDALDARLGDNTMSGEVAVKRLEPLEGLEANLAIDMPKLGPILASFGIAAADLPPFEAKMQVEPGKDDSLVTADLRVEDASVHLDGKVDDLSAPLDAFEASLAVDAPKLGPILASFEVPHADQLASAKLDAKVEHRAESTTVVASGDVGGDAIKIDAAYDGAVTAFLNPRGTLHLEGSALGALPAQLGFAKRPIESYRIAAQVEERSGETSPVNLDVTIEDTRVRFDGSIDELRTFKGVDGQFQVQGPDPAAILDLFKLPAISLPPYDFAGHATWRDDDIKVADLDGTFGDSDARGAIAIDLRPAPPAVTADLQSDRLVMDDLAGVIGAPVNPEAKQQQGKLLPTGKIDPKAWKNLDMDVRYKTGRIESTYLPIDRIEAHVISKKGWLTLDPVRTGLADGAITAFASLDGTQDPVAGNFDVRLEALQLQDMLTKLGVSGEGLGEIDGRIRLEGKGRSVDALLGSADGQIVLSMTGGSIDALILEAIGLDIAESIVVLLDASDQSEEDKVPIRCAIVNLQLDQGIATTRPVVIDTTDSKITVDGTINLKDETLDIMIESHPKDTSLFSANQPIHVDGALLSPSVNPAPGEVENEALGWLLAPVAAVLPFFDLGGEPDSPCGSLIAQAKDAAAERPQ